MTLLSSMLEVTSSKVMLSGRVTVLSSEMENRGVAIPNKSVPSVRKSAVFSV